MNTILLNDAKFADKLIRMGAALNGLDPQLTDNIPEASSCDGIMIHEYVQCIKEIAALIKKMELLAEKDMREIYKSAAVMKAVDYSAALRFSGGGGGGGGLTGR